jgi:hypothetical protein
VLYDYGKRHDRAVPVQLGWIRKSTGLAQRTGHWNCIRSLLGSLLVVFVDHATGAGQRISLYR